MVLESSFGLDHEECDKNPNGRIEVAMDDRDELNGKEVGIAAQALPINYIMTPVVPK